VKIAPKNWKEFQHYKDRNPTWIKLHKKLLDDFKFQRLPLASRALAPMLWLLASEHEDGVFDANPELIAFRIRANTEEVEAALSPLIGKGFFSVVQFDSAPLAEAERVAIPETYKAEKETPISSASPPRRPKTDPEETDGFKRFWDAWPKSPRKVDRFKCFEQWRKDKLEGRADEVVAHVQVSRTSKQWLDKFEPAPLKYLKNRRYMDPVLAVARPVPVN
jgi:hypothetical protein